MQYGKGRKIMSLKRVDPEDAYIVNIKWSRPASYEEITASGSRHDPEGSLYMILGYYGSSHPKIFYVGKVTATYVSRRLRQPDHRKRYEWLQTQHPRHTFKVCLGEVEIVQNNVTRRRIDEIETMLIYTVHKSHPHMINKRKCFAHRVHDAYVIHNRRYRNPLPKEIHLGIFKR